MNNNLFAGLAVMVHVMAFSQPFRPIVSMGARNSISVLNSDQSFGNGLGEQIRVQITKRLNSEWYHDNISSKTAITRRNDFQVGGGFLYYLNKNYDSSKLLRPFLIIGYCFEKAEVFAIDDSSNSAANQGMASQAGLGTHIRITPKLDCSVSAKYQMHFGKKIESFQDEEGLIIQTVNDRRKDGNILFTISLNFFLFTL